MKNDFLVLDIETIPDPDVPASSDWDPEKILSVPYHKIVCIGALLFDADYRIKSLGILSEAKPERGVVEDFIRFVDSRTPTLVTFNGRGFDLPVIAMRCLKYGIPFRHYYQARDVRYRYTADGHFDVMDFLSDFGGTKSARLDAVAKLIGMPGKVGVDGKGVAGLVAAGKFTEVCNYCLCDVVQTAGIFLRTQFLRGEIQSIVYLNAMAELVMKINGDPRLKPVAESMNVERLMLTE